MFWVEVEQRKFPGDKAMQQHIAKYHKAGGG